MRLRNLWTILVSILLLAACSSEMVTDSATPREGTDAVSYARLNVNLPTVPATRAYTPDAGDEA
jgi:PBP1b-binding outer membrane lipoprotein LpoB